MDHGDGKNESFINARRVTRPRVMSLASSFDSIGMDDTLEQPTALSRKPTDLQLEDDGQSSEDEDSSLDWTKLM
jgi:hypothetical protein